MNVLAIDTAAGLCAACVYEASAGVVRGRCVLDIGKGHAEHLMGVIESALAEAKLAYSDIDRIAVSVGPGSFTGVRVGVSVARGLALALDKPAIGMTTLEALATEARMCFPDRAIAAVLDGRRGDLYFAGFDQAGVLLSGPAAVSIDAARAFALQKNAVLAGSGTDLVIAGEHGYDFDIASRKATAEIGTYARLAAMREPPFEKPKPLYLRGADAKPQTGFALARADG
jgi:tRNA threonylcarbamoyladenosine biosynthesis protein TsaB